MATPTSLRADLEQVWAADTAVDPDAWRSDRPSTGHCAVTALLVQEYCGGRILRGIVDAESHYWNEVEGSEVDLTRDQFEAWNLEGEPEERTREYLLSNEATARRYETLRRRLGEHWFGIA